MPKHIDDGWLERYRFNIAQWVPEPLPFDGVPVERYDSLTDAIADVGSVNPVVLTCSSATTITGNTTITSNITFVPRPGCTISASSAYNLTVIGPLLAAPFKWVGSNVTVKFVQVDNSTNTPLAWVYAEWWGAVGSDGTDDTAAFNAALAAMKTSRGVALRLLARPYRASVTIPAPTNEIYPVVILGSGDGSSIRTHSSSSPAISLDLGISDPNAKILIRDVSFIGRGTMTVPVVSLKAQGGTTNRLYGELDNVKVVGSGNLADAIYIRGGLAMELAIFTQEGRYALYLEGCSNTIMRSVHAGNATCNGIMINGGGSSTIVRARIEDSNTPNTRAISSISGNGTTVTVVTSTAHNMETMDRITLSGNSGSYNFTSPRRITVVNPTTFTYDGMETGAGTGGTVLISASALRLKNTSFNMIYDFANEGKTNLDYTLWLQSDGTSISGEPSCSHNVFSGGVYGAVSNTSRTDLSTILIEGCCTGNRGYGLTVGHSVPINSNSWEFRHERNVVGIRPRNNKFEGGLYSGIGGSYAFHFYEEIPGGAGNYAELYEKATERVFTAGNRRNIYATDFIDENSCGAIIYTDGASSTVTISFTFDFFEGMRPITFVNNSSQLLRLDPHGTNSIGTGGAGKYLELAAGASVVLGCLIHDKGAIMFSSGSLSYEP